MLEKDIEQTVVDWAKKHDFLALKVTFTENGYPDRLFISPHGHTIFIEFKRPGEQPRALQSHRIAELVRHCVPATWTSSAVEAINILRACLEPARLPDPCDQATPVPSSSGPVLRSGSWKDIYRARSTEDSIFERACQAGFDRSAAQAHVLGLAGRDKEVEQFQQLDLFHPARDPEGDGPNYGLTDSLD